MSDKKTKRIMRKFKMREISGVDRPAQVGASVTIMKRADNDEDERKRKPGESDKDYAARIAKCGDHGYQNPRLLTDVEGHSHLIDASANGGQSSYEKMPDEEYGHTHPWIADADGSIRIGAAAGHSHEVLNTNTVGKAAVGSNNGETMSDTKQPTAELDAVNKQLATITAELSIAKAFGELTDAQKSLYGKLDDAGKTAFLKLSPEARQAKVDEVAKAATESNPVVYTSTDGEQFRKNDDPRLITMAKRADEDRKARIAADIRSANETLAKRAGTELVNCPGDEVVKVALLRAIDGITDEAQRTGALALLKASNEALGKAFVRTGTSTPAPANVGSQSAAEAELDRLAKAYASEKKVDYFTAYEAVSKMQPELFAKAVGTAIPA